MNRFVIRFRNINAAILFVSCIVGITVIPVGVAFAVIYGVILSWVMNKRQQLIANTIVIIIMLFCVYLYHTEMYYFLNHLFGMLVRSIKTLNSKSVLSVFTIWYTSWEYAKLMLFGCGLIFVAVLQGVTLFNGLVVLFSSELLHNIAKTPKKKQSNYKKAEKMADKLNGYSAKDGTVLGVELGGNTPIVITDSELNGHLFVAGTTGSGKTVTLKNFIWSAIERGIPLVYLDGKGDQKLPHEIAAKCKEHGREFKLFEMDSESNVKYNPLTVGEHSELKDKIITMKTVDSSDGKYYQTAEGEYLQFLFKVLKRSGKHIDLYSLGSYITMPKLFDLISSIGDKDLQDEAREIKDRLGKRLDGLISDINTFVKSELGHLFDCSSGPVIDLQEDIRNGAVIYFSLNDLNYAEYASRLGKLVINDLKTVFGRVPEHRPLKAFCIFDEFTTYAGEQFNTILSRTRSKGMHAIVGSQSFDTIDKISPVLASDLIANCNTYIIHRQNSDIDAEKLADVIGKKTNFKVSFNNSVSVNQGSQHQSNSEGSSRTYSSVREHRVNPEEIQNLGSGYACVLRKALGSKVAMVKVRFIKA